MKPYRNNKSIISRFLLLTFGLVLTSGLIMVLNGGGFSTARQSKITRADSIATEKAADKPDQDKEDEKGGRDRKIPMALPDFRTAIDFFLSFFRTFRPSAYNETVAVPVTKAEVKDSVQRI